VVIDEWLVDYQRAGEMGTVEAQLDIVWPTIGTPNSTEGTEDRCFRMIGSQSASEGQVQQRHRVWRPGTSGMNLTFGDEPLTNTVSMLCPRSFAATPRCPVLEKGGPRGLGHD
jgi:hypothetical protein